MGSESHFTVEETGKFRLLISLNINWKATVKSAQSGVHSGLDPVSMLLTASFTGQVSMA